MKIILYIKFIIIIIKNGSDCQVLASFSYQVMGQANTKPFAQASASKVQYTRLVGAEVKDTQLVGPATQFTRQVESKVKDTQLVGPATQVAQSADAAVQDAQSADAAVYSAQSADAAVQPNRRDKIRRMVIIFAQNLNADPNWRKTRVSPVWSRYGHW